MSTNTSFDGDRWTAADESRCEGPPLPMTEDSPYEVLDVGEFIKWMNAQGQVYASQKMEHGTQTLIVNHRVLLNENRVKVTYTVHYNRNVLYHGEDLEHAIEMYNVGLGL